MPQPPFDLRRALIQQLQDLRAAGVRELPRIEIPAAHFSPSGSESAARSAVESEDTRCERPLNMEESKMSQESKSSAAEVAAQVSGGDKQSQLNELAEKVAGCTLCSELAASRRQTVFGVGNPDARVAFFGEAPGADEDRQGEPFVGRAGQLLTKIIAACTWQREDVYIFNTIKCRPPGNRNPEPDELYNCRPYWQKQLEIIEPEYIVCLGKYAMQELLNTPPSQSIGRMRKKLHRYGEAKVVVTYHPSYLLRNPAAKKDVWEDMKMLMRDMGIEVS